MTLLVLAHVFARSVSSERVSPPGHFGEPCGACHMIDEQAETIDFTK